MDLKLFDSCFLREIAHFRSNIGVKRALARSKCREVGRIGLAGQMARRQMSPQHGSEAEAEAKALQPRPFEPIWIPFGL